MPKLSVRALRVHRQRTSALSLVSYRAWVVPRATGHATALMKTLCVNTTAVVPYARRGPCTLRWTARYAEKRSKKLVATRAEGRAALLRPHLVSRHAHHYVTFALATGRIAQIVIVAGTHVTRHPWIPGANFMVLSYLHVAVVPTFAPGQKIYAVLAASLCSDVP